jgi:plasmid maintenance system antidote protein VapI
MALRIEKAFGPKMEHLMRMQLAYELAQVRRRTGAIKVKADNVGAPAIMGSTKA